MFKKLLIVCVLCFSIQTVSSATPTADARSEIIHEYEDEDFIVIILTDELDLSYDRNDKERNKATYNILTTKPGIKMVIDQSIDGVIGYSFKPSLYLPNAPIYIMVADNDDNDLDMIFLTFVSEDMKTLNFGFFSPDIVNMNPRAFLSSPVAQKAFKKVGFTLTKEQIDSMVEIKYPTQSVNHSVDK